MAKDFLVNIVLKASDQASKVIAGVAAPLSQLDAKLKAGGEAQSAFQQKWGATLQATAAVGRGMTVAGGAIVTSLTLAAKQAGDYGGMIFDATRKTGMAAEKLTALKFAAEQSGVSFQGLTTGIRMQARSAVEAANGSKQAQAAYKTLGVSVTDASGKLKDGRTLMLESADALRNIQDPTLRASLAMKVFGRSGVEMLPMLMEGSEGIAKLEARAKQLGLTMTDEMAAAADEAGDRMEAAKAAMQAAFVNLGVVVLPIIASITDKIATVAAVFTKWAQAHPTLAKGLAAVALGVGAVWMVVGPLLMAAPGIISIIQFLNGAGGLVPLIGTIAKIAGGLTGLGPLVAGLGAKLAALAAAAWPITLVALAIAGLAYELYKLKQSYDATSAAAKQANESFKAAQATADAYAAKTGTQSQLAWQRAEQERAPVTLSDRFWGAVTGGGRTSKDIARERVAMGQAAPGRAAGGPVIAGRAYMVGEKAPELFVPDAAGRIMTMQMAEGMRERYETDMAAIDEAFRQTAAKVVAQTTWRKERTLTASNVQAAMRPLMPTPTLPDNVAASGGRGITNVFNFNAPVYGEQGIRDVARDVLTRAMTSAKYA